MTFDLNSLLRLMTDTSWLDRIARKVFGVMPDWLHLGSSIVAVYVILAAIAAMALINTVLTLEFVASGNVRRRYSPIGKVLLIACDAGLGYMIYQLLTA